MTPAEYAAFVDDVHARYDDETAARMIEQKCRPPYKPPLRIDIGQARARAVEKQAAPGGAA